MSETGETIKTLSPSSFEKFSMLEDEGLGVAAALGYQALALAANNTTLARSYFDRSQTALENEEASKPRQELPRQPEVFARALLNLSPLIKTLVVDRRISEVADVATAGQYMAKDLGKHARASKKLMLNTRLTDESLIYLRSTLIPAFNTLALQGLFMRIQTDIIRSNDWMALPAFWYPSQIQWKHNNEQEIVDIMPTWDISIFEGTQTDFSCTQRIYVRNGRYSDHKSIQTEDDIAVVWVTDDLKRKEEKPEEVALNIINDLQSETNRGRARVEERAEKLLDAIEKRNLASIKSKN